MNEFKLINSIKQSYYKQSSVIKGVGDDGAIFQPPIGQQIIVATDTMVEDVHFSFNYMAFEDVGYRVLAANLSDLAAMGSMPLYYMVNIAAPAHMDHEQLVKIFSGMKELADIYNIDLIGGDTVQSKQLVITVTVFGSVFSRLKRLRNQAKVGDVIFCTGFLGESAYGLDILKNKLSGNDDYFINRHIRPKPRLDFSFATNDIERLCLNDISDGLASELNEIAENSNVNMEVDWGKIPINKKMKILDVTTLKKYALFSGEDFELVGTCSEQTWERLKNVCENENIVITQIGKVHHVLNNRPSVFLKDDKSIKKLKKQGYQHGVYNDKGD